MSATVTPGYERIWTPHSKQRMFLEIPFSVKERFYGGAAAGGKSDCLVMFPICKGWHENPYFKGIIFRRKFPQLDASLIPKSKEWYPHFGGKYNETKHMWHFPSGAWIKFDFMEKDDDARSHDTNEYSYIGFEELTEFSEWQYTYVTMSRGRVPKYANLPVVFVSASNPGNVGHEWVKKRFIDAAHWGEIIEDEKTHLRRMWIKATAYDNPHISEEYLLQLQNLPEAERRAKLEGDWNAYYGSVFTEFRPTKLDFEPPEALHVIPYFAIPDWWPKVLAVDWGYDHKTSAGWGALSPDNRIFVYRVYNCTRTSIANWGADLARLSQFDGNLVAVKLDPSAWQERGLPDTIASQFDAASGFLAEKADNDRLGGKLLLHELFRWTQKAKRRIPDSGYDAERGQRILRMHGLSAFRAYCTAYEPEPNETNIPRLQIFEDGIDDRGQLIGTQSLIDTIPLCSYDDKLKEGKKKEDVKKFNGDDDYDMVRYLTKGMEFWRTEVELEANRRTRIDAVYQDFKRSGDATTFYRRMAEVEAEQRGPRPLSSRRIAAHGRVLRFARRSASGRIRLY